MAITTVIIHTLRLLKNQTSLLNIKHPVKSLIQNIQSIWAGVPQHRWKGKQM